MSTPNFNVHVCTIFMVVVLLFMCHYCSQGAWSQHHNNWSLQRCHPGHREAGVISLDGLPLLSRYCYMRVRWWYDIILYTHIDVYMSLVSIVIVAQEMDLERQRNWNMKWGNWITAMLYCIQRHSNLQIITNVITSCHLCLPQKQSFG